MGGTGSRYTGPRSENVREKIEQAQERERERLGGQVDDLIRALLAHMNNRDTDEVAKRLDKIENQLGEIANLETLLFGGSVAKHTAVNGVSDVDALVILDRKREGKESPEFLIEAFRRLLQIKLPRSEVTSVKKGRLAVTVKYRDGEEVQLLPALRSGGTVYIASPDGKDWQETKPQVFQQALTRANVRMNQALVPTIKLMKSINAGLPQQKQLQGYHIEALAVDAASTYSGAKTPRKLLTHILGHAAQRVLQPISDVTGQAHTIDSYLGEASSLQRRNVSQTLSGYRRRLESATSLSRWRAVLGEPDR